GQGMGAALNIASASNAYVLSDRGTWLSFKNRGDLAISVQGDKRLFNQYGVMLVNPEKHPGVKKELGQAFIDWLVSPEGQKAIADYKIGGEQLFYPNADDPSARCAAALQLFARNRLCALVKPGLNVDSANLLERMLDPAIKLATSTPKADPTGDYALEVFAKAESIRSGARAALEKKAAQLTGRADSLQPS